ncbi:MAG TPA: glycerophosphodiester phosphodiesterase [Streptosporangiaceae bacterium]|nr:glycerophosphodiester phosphodiesterase [Streptosporangiaceae bacterium]
MIFEGQPAVVGHRGFGAGQPDGYRENSVESFLAAARHGVRWVELDARRSSDGELVLWHDPVTADGQLIAGRTAAELAVAGIAALADVLAVLPAGVGVNIDVKTTMKDATDPPAQRTHALIAAALHHYQGTRPFLISSFDPSRPAYLKDHSQLTGGEALGLITDERYPAAPAISAAANLGLEAVCLPTDALPVRPAQPGPGRLSAEELLRHAHAAGLEVLTWSPDPADAVLLAQAGVDAVCVNDIPGVEAALRRAELPAVTDQRPEILRPAGA